MTFSEIVTSGEGFPEVGIVSLVHGDDPYGSRVIGELSQTTKLERGTLHTIYANLPASFKRKRQIDFDLNQAFPGREHGLLEHRAARNLREILDTCAFVLDIHTSNQEHAPYVLIPTTETTAKVAPSYAHSDLSILDRKRIDLDHLGTIAASTGISRRVVLPSALSQGSSLVDYVNAHGKGYGILLQVGSFQGKSATEIALDALRSFLATYGLQEGVPQRAERPEVYLGREFTAEKQDTTPIAAGEHTTFYCPAFQEQRPFLRVQRIS